MPLSLRTERKKKPYSNLIFMKQFLFTPRGNLIDYIYSTSDKRLKCKMLLNRNQQFQQKLLRRKKHFFDKSNKRLFLCRNFELSKCRMPNKTQ